MMRVRVGCNYVRQPFWKIIVGVPLVYLPIITTVPFVIIGIVLVKTHLKYVGGMDIRSYWDFVPDWASHRFKNSEQPAITIPWYQPAHYPIFWILNCKHYCPLSVALFKYAAYLVMIVENWWCPFAHGKKEEYTPGAIDSSFWHIDTVDSCKLDPADEQNPIWNEKSERSPHLPPGSERELRCTDSASEADHSEAGHAGAFALPPALKLQAIKQENAGRHI